LIIWALLIIYVNGAIGVVRYLAGEEATGGKFSDNQITEFLTSALSPLSWPHFDFNSLLLTGIGILFALVALMDGYLVKDRYPGYSERGDQYDQALDHLRTTLEYTQEDLQTAHTKAKEKFTSDRDEKYQSVTDIQNKLLKMKTTTEHFKIDTGVISDRTLSTLKMYRSINEQNRSTDPPKYFSDDELSLATKNYYNDNFFSIHTNAKLDPHFNTEDDGTIPFNKNEIELQANNLGETLNTSHEDNLESTLRLYNKITLENRISDDLS